MTTGFLSNIDSTSHMILRVLEIIALFCVLKIRPNITFTYKHVKYFAAFRMKLIKQQTMMHNLVIYLKKICPV